MQFNKNLQFIFGLMVLAVLGFFIYFVGCFAGKAIYKAVNEPKTYYTVEAKFTNINGLKENAQVKVGGLAIGYVSRLELDPKTYEPIAFLAIKNTFKDIPASAQLLIKTNGILGDRYLEFAIKADQLKTTEFLAEGSVILNTTSAMDLEDIISNVAFGDK